MYALTQEQQLLPDILHRDQDSFPTERLAQLDAAGWDALFHLAVELRVVPAVYERLKQRFASPRTSTDTRDSAAQKSSVAKITSTGQSTSDSVNNSFSSTLNHFAAYSREVAKKNLRYFGELQRYLTRLKEAGIPVIPLKGIWLAHDVYPGKGMREMNDIDLLFRYDDLPEALRIVTEMGYLPEIPIHMRENLQKSHHLPPLIRKQIAVFELHWNITGPNKPYYIAPDTLWERARPGRMTGLDVMLLSPEDQLLHLALHTSYQHLFAFGLRPFYDIATTIQYFRRAGTSDPQQVAAYTNAEKADSKHGNNALQAVPALDWDLFCDRCIAFGWQRGVRLALTLSRDLVGAEVPDNVYARLQAEPDIDQELKNVALEQLFTKKKTVAQIPLPLVDMLEQKGVAGKLKAIWNRVYLPESNMLTKYPFERGSKWRYYYYLVRIHWLIRSYTVNMIRLMRGEKKLSGVVTRKKRLQSWMNQETND